MSREAIEKRFEAFQEKRKEQERQDRREKRALDAVPTMITELKKAVTENVNASNEAFAGIPGARCFVTDVHDGFEVIRQGATAESRRVLQIEQRVASSFVGVQLREVNFPVSPPRVAATEQIEIRGEGDGELYYVHRGDKYKRGEDTDALALALLDAILPGEKDLDKQR